MDRAPDHEGRAANSPPGRTSLGSCRGLLVDPVVELVDRLAQQVKAFLESPQAGEAAFDLLQLVRRHRLEPDRVELVHRISPDQTTLSRLEASSNTGDLDSPGGSPGRVTRSSRAAQCCPRHLLNRGAPAVVTAAGFFFVWNVGGAAVASWGLLSGRS